MKDAIIIMEGATQLHCVYEGSYRTVSLNDPRCKLYIEKLSKHYNIRVASMTTETAESLMTRVDDYQKLLQRKVQAKTNKQQHVEDVEKSTAYRTTCAGPLVLGDIGIIVDPSGFIDLKSLGSKAKSNDLNSCIRSGMLVKTTSAEIAQMVKDKRQREYNADQSSIINTSVKEFTGDGDEEGPMGSVPLDITNDVARMSDSQLNNPNQSMSALMAVLDGDA